MLNWFRNKWRAIGDRNEELATLRGMLKSSEAKNVRLKEHLAVLDRRMDDLERFVNDCVILRRI